MPIQICVKQILKLVKVSKESYKKIQNWLKNAKKPIEASKVKIISLAKMRWKNEKNKQWTPTKVEGYWEKKRATNALVVQQDTCAPDEQKNRAILSRESTSAWLRFKKLKRIVTIPIQMFIFTLIYILKLRRMTTLSFTLR